MELQAHRPLSDRHILSESVLLSLNKPVICLSFEFEWGGGGAWESNPPSTRKLAEQPF